MSIKISILFRLMCSYKDRTVKDFYANQYNIQANEKDDEANADQLYDTTREQMLKRVTCRVDLCLVI